MKKYWSSGEIPAEGDYVYVVRPCDELVWDKMLDASSGKISVLYGSRQSGKSSLLNRLAERAKRTHKEVRVVVDQVYGSDVSKYSRELNLLDQLLEMIAEKAGRFDAYRDWNDRLLRERAVAANNVDERFLRFMAEVLAPDPRDRVLLIFDEFDHFRSFGPLWQFLLRCFYGYVHSPIAERVRMVIAGLVRPTELVADRDNSKWTIFDTHWVGDFDAGDRETVRALARGLHDRPGRKEERAAELAARAAGGHPYLTITLLELIAESGSLEESDIENVIAGYIARNRRGKNKTKGEADPHFNFAATYLQKSGDLGPPSLLVFEKLRAGERDFDVDSDIENTLRGAGLVSLAEGIIRVKSRIVREVFDETWIANERTRLLDVRSGQKIDASRSSARSRGRALPKVVILNIGGTLGMDYGPNDEELAPATPERFLSDVPDILDLVEPIVERLFSPLDGANIAPPQWRLLAEKINSYRDSGIDGVVVITGTDTMAFTASAVAFALGKTLNFPVAFVGAQARRKKLFADSAPNLLRALVVAAEGKALPQVVIVFNDQIFRAVRSDKRDDFRYDGFWAPTEGPLAVFVEEIRYQIDPEKLRELFGDAGSEPRIDFEERILTISQRPGLQPELFLPLLDPDKVKGILIESLGVGNLPTNEDYSFAKIFETAIEKSIPVLIASRYPVQPELAAYYAPAKKFLELAPYGVMSGSDMVPPAASVKFMWAIAEIRRRYKDRQGVDDAMRLRALGDLMSTNLVGEIRQKEPTKRSRAN